MDADRDTAQNRARLNIKKKKPSTVKIIKRIKPRFINRTGLPLSDLGLVLLQNRVRFPHNLHGKTKTVYGFGLEYNQARFVLH